MQNFERELTAGRQGDIGLHSRNKTMVVEDDEEVSSCDSMFAQVTSLGFCFVFSCSYITNKGVSC